MLILSFPDSISLASAIADKCDCGYAAIEVHAFPDGESRVRLPAELPEHVVLCRSLDQPNDKLIELMLAARGARTLGARRITLVAPYLCYMRQDKAFHAGEAVSQRIIGEFLASFIDTLVTVDPHLHRVPILEEAVPVAKAYNISAARQMGRYLKCKGISPLLLGPDQESRQWVGLVAETAGLEFLVADKVRRGDRDVTVVLPQADYAGREVVVVDDVASSGRTLAEAAEALLAAGATRVDALVTHALFADGALSSLHAAGISEVWSSDTIPHESNVFSLAEELAAVLM